MINMKKIGEYIIYRRDVCKIIDIKKNHINQLDYYVLVPVNDSSLHIDVPIDNHLGYIRELMSREEVDKLIERIPNISIIDANARHLEEQYKKLLDNGEHEGLIKIIKTTYLRNKKRLDNKKKISDKDQYYFDLAEHYLYDEISVILNKSFEETKEYVIKHLRLKND